MKIVNVRPSPYSFWTETRMVGHYIQVEYPGWHGLVALHVWDEAISDEDCKEAAAKMVKDHIDALGVLSL